MFYSYRENTVAKCPKESPDKFYLFKTKLLSSNNFLIDFFFIKYINNIYSDVDNRLSLGIKKLRIYI